MPCYAPLHGYLSQHKTAKGKRRIVFNIETGFRDRHVTVPCGACTGCISDRARDWAIRCAHEAQMHEHNAFLTLTYDDDHVPHINDDPDAPFTLRPADFTNFMKRLRKARNNKLRYLQAGEYGSLGRPHHHALIFGLNFPDMKRHQKRNDYWLYTSDELASLWTHGFSSIGTVTVQSGMYVAQYTLKKQTPRVHQDRLAVPEYATMSRRPGLGYSWLHTYGGDIYPEDLVVTSTGNRAKPPRYYDNILATYHPEGLERLKNLRRAQLNELEQTSGRLYARQECHRARIAHAKDKSLT